MYYKMYKDSIIHLIKVALTVSPCCQNMGSVSYLFQGFMFHEGIICNISWNSVDQLFSII